MHLICLCPTYGRPSLVANALALFLRQRVPGGCSALLHVFDDAGQLRPVRYQGHPHSLRIDMQDTWIPLQRKYDWMLQFHDGWIGNADAAFVVWDDDDVYLPWHLISHAAALKNHRWSHPSTAWSTYGINPLAEPPARRELSGRSYHGALAIRGDLMEDLRGWPDTDRSDYDKQQLARCADEGGPKGDPTERHPPSYVYRWADTDREHISARIRNGRYPRPRIQEPGHNIHLSPNLDPSTRAILANLA